MCPCCAPPPAFAISNSRRARSPPRPPEVKSANSARRRERRGSSRSRVPPPMGSPEQVQRRAAAQRRRSCASRTASSAAVAADECPWRRPVRVRRGRVCRATAREKHRRRHVDPTTSPFWPDHLPKSRVEVFPGHSPVEATPFAPATRPSEAASNALLPPPCPAPSTPCAARHRAAGATIARYTRGHPAETSRSAPCPGRRPVLNPPSPGRSRKAAGSAPPAWRPALAPPSRLEPSTLSPLSRPACGLWPLHLPRMVRTLPASGAAPGSASLRGPPAARTRWVLEPVPTSPLLLDAVPGYRAWDPPRSGFRMRFVHVIWSAGSAGVEAPSALAHVPDRPSSRAFPVGAPFEPRFHAPENLPRPGPGSTGTSAVR